MRQIDFLVWAYTVVGLAVIFLVELTYDIPVHGHIDYAWCLWVFGCVAWVQWNYWKD